MAMSFLGVGSGLQLGALLEKLESAEQLRLGPIILQKQKFESKISAFGQLKSALSTFSKATEELQKAESFEAHKAKGNNKFFKVTASNDVPLGDYTINITSIAKSHSIASAAMKDAKTALGNDDATRTITIAQANGQKMEVMLGKDETSLDAIANAINNGTIKNEKGETEPSTMNASVVRSSDGNYQLVITSKETGEKNAITSVSSSDDKLNGAIGFGNGTSGMKEITKAQDAEFTFNGIEIKSASNTIKDVVKGLDITLKSSTQSEEKITISSDNKKTKEALKEWVKAYNDLQSTFASLTKFTKSEEKTSREGEEKKDELNGPLIGDTTLREIDQRIRSVFSHAQEGKFSVLSQVGINMDDKGKLILNEKELDKVLNDDPAAVSKLFTGDGEKTGIANELVLGLKQYTESNGTLDTVTKGLKSSLKSEQARYDRMEDSIEQTLTRYRKQFAALDSLVATLNNTSQYLANQFMAMK